MKVLNEWIEAKIKLAKEVGKGEIQEGKKFQGKKNWICWSENNDFSSENCSNCRCSKWCSNILILIDRKSKDEWLIHKVTVMHELLDGNLW